MTKHQLAQALRQRQYRLALLEKHVIEGISDDEIINDSIICSDDGEKLVTPQELRAAIKFANNAEQFFRLCEGLAHARAVAAVTARATFSIKAEG